MSSILKALEKVDESQRQRRSAGGGIGRGRGSRPAWLAPAWALGGAAVAALATYALMGGFTRPTPVAEKTERPAVAQAPATAPQTVAEIPQQVQRQVAVPAVQPVAAPVAKVTAKPVQPAAKTALKAAVPSTSPAVAKSKVQVVAKAAAMPVGRQPAAVKTAQPVLNAALQPPAEAATAAAVVPEPVPQKSRPAIRVSGIAWQNSSEASFAMVNGRAMRQGAVVEGYKIEQIYEDSVRFSSSKGNSLVVPLGAGDE